MSWRDLLRGLWHTIVPTPAQALISIFLSLVVLAGIQSNMILARLGISSEAIQSTHDQFMQRFSVVLQSSIASHIALVAFWAAIGLIAYLICWGGYNILVEARNEVTLETQYTNRAHWRGSLETLALKASVAVILLIYIVNFSYGLSFWLTLSSLLIDSPSVTSVLTGLGAVLGMALQLYILLVLVQLTVTSWYRSDRLQEG